jgi:hypothetical protein
MVLSFVRLRRPPRRISLDMVFFRISDRGPSCLR